MSWALSGYKKPSSKQPKWTSFSEDVVNTLIDGILYEPTNAKKPKNHYIGGTDVDDEWTYIGGEAPSSLNSYLHEFASQSTSLVENETVKVLHCKGPTNGHAGHDFLAPFHHSKCHLCKADICKMCTDVSKRKEGGKATLRDYCIPCSMVERLLPGTNINNILTVTEMRNELKNEFAFDGVENLSPDEVEDAWKAHSLHRELKELSEQTDFPVYPPSAIKTNEHWNII